MLVESHVTIAGSKQAIWQAITDIEHHAQIISGIDKIEIVNKPPNGIVGLRWKETRMLFGKPATVEKWITEAVDNEFYKTQAEDGGFVFITTMRISQMDAGMMLTCTHDSQPQTFVAKLMTIPMRLFFKGMIRKAAMKDLSDLKGVIERR